MHVPSILVVNDDGIFAPGLLALVAELSKSDCQVFVCAPHKERSAQSHAITLYEDLKVKAVSLPGATSAVQVSGTPADCARLALHAWCDVFPEFQDCLPDLVVSGVNRGPNRGMDCVYSGTVAGAREAAMNGFYAVSISHFNFRAKTEEDFRDAAAIVMPLVLTLARHRTLPSGAPLPPKGCVLNINVPHLPLADIKGYHVTHQGNSMIMPRIVETTSTTSGGVWGSWTKQASQTGWSSGVLSLTCSCAALALLLTSSQRGVGSKDTLTAPLLGSWRSSVISSLTLLPPALTALTAFTNSSNAGNAKSSSGQRVESWDASTRTFATRIKHVAEDNRPGSDSQEAASNAWVSVTPLGNNCGSDVGTVAFTNDLAFDYRSFLDNGVESLGKQAANFVSYVGRESGVVVYEGSSTFIRQKL